MSIVVKTFNDRELSLAIKQSPVIIQQYIQSLLNLQKIQQETIVLAKKKIFELVNKCNNQ